MAKFHINKKGVPAPCKAKPGNCPLGGDEQHFGTKEEAQKFANEKNKKLFGILQKEPNPKIRYNLERLEEAKTELDEAKALPEDNPDKSEYIRAAEQSIEYYSLLVDNERKGIFFDTETFKNLRDDDGSIEDGFIEDELDYLIDEYLVKPRGEVYSYMFLSKRESPYGKIAKHGAEGYMATKSLSPKYSITRLMDNNNRVTMRDNEGVLEVVVSHHDGKDICEMKPIVVSRMDDYERLRNYGTVDEVVEYLKKVPSVKIKKDKRFNK